MKRYITEIFADNMEILSTSKSGSQDSSSRNNSSNAPLPSGTPSDDLPF